VKDDKDLNALVHQVQSMIMKELGIESLSERVKQTSN
jgi:hypothetical protein